jgi:formylglycine-generating enzyme
MTRTTLILLSLSTLANADQIGTLAIAFSDIGNAGNANDSGSSGLYSSPYGAVDYDYRMSITEISVSMLSAAGLPAGSWIGDQPATVNWYQAAGFVNWLNTSTGHQPAYRLNAGLTALTLWSSAEAWQAGGENLYRHKDAHYFLPSEDEWYKAAYHQNNGATADYWDYATASNSIPTAVASGVGAGTAVYHRGSFSSPADVQISGGSSAYGTIGQGGNVWEWTESANDGTNDSASEYRAFRGGYWNSNESNLRSSTRNYNAPSVVDYSVGFRVASVPEPSALAILLVGLLALIGRRNRP